MVRYSLLAGEQALATYAYEDAIPLFQRALGAQGGQPPGPNTADLLFGLGRAQAALRSEAALQNLRWAFDLYADAGDLDRVVAIAEYADYGDYLSGQPSAGVTGLIAQALTLVPPDSHRAGRLLSRYGQVLGLEGTDDQEARKAFQGALVIARREGDAALEMRTLAAAASVDSNHTRYGDRLRNSLQAIDLVGQVDDPRIEVAARYFAVTALTTAGDLNAALQHAGAMMAPA